MHAGNAITPSTHKVIFKKKYLFVLFSEGLGGRYAIYGWLLQYNPRTSFIRMSHLPYSKAPKMLQIHLCECYCCCKVCIIEPSIPII